MFGQTSPAGRGDMRLPNRAAQPSIPAQKFCVAGRLEAAQVMLRCKGMSTGYRTDLAPRTPLLLDRGRYHPWP